MILFTGHEAVIRSGKKATLLAEVAVTVDLRTASLPPTKIDIGASAIDHGRQPRGDRYPQKGKFVIHCAVLIFKLLVRHKPGFDVLIVLCPLLLSEGQGCLAHALSLDRRTGVDAQACCIFGVRRFSLYFE